MVETIKESNISLNFHKFNYEKTGEEIFFTFLKNREKDLKKSGINKLYTLLSTEYDNVDHAVSTTLSHKIVFEKIETISNRKNEVPTKNLRKVSMRTSKTNVNSFIEANSLKPRKKSSSFSSNEYGGLSKGLKRSTSNIKESLDDKKEGGEDENSKKKEEEEEPFIEVSDLLEKLNENNELNENFERDQLENILEDLHKLGLIVYFKKKSLSDTIISNPQWFNNIFKIILDFGRKNVSKFFESFFNYSKEIKNKKTREEITKITIWLKGTSKKESFREIWNDKEELKISNLDKISFENLLRKLEDLIEKLIEEKELEIFEKMDEFKNFNYSSVSQKFIFVDEQDLVSGVVGVILEKYQFLGDKIYKQKKEFLMNILSQFDFVIPKTRVKYYKNDVNSIVSERSFVIPLLFSPYKPQSSFSFLKLNSSKQNLGNESEDDNTVDWKNLKFDNEWLVDYFLPFKPSAIWKLLFMRIRSFCVGPNESKRKLIEEIYWIEGFSFFLIEADKMKSKTHLQLEFFKDEDKSGPIKMKITIKSNLFDIDLFYSSLHQVIQIFVKEWIVPELYKKIIIKITKLKENKEFFSTQNHFKISENLNFDDSIQYLSNFDENDEENQNFMCMNCGLTLNMLDLKETNSCDKCKNI